MKDRIVWIDWIKVIGITIVIFCHVPQETPATLELRFSQTLQMPLMFLISGLLYKCPGNGGVHTQMHKYWEQLIVPMLLFCLIGWPYFVVRETVDTGSFSFYASFVRPIIDAFTLQTPTNGTLWYVVALLEMKVVSDLCFSFKRPLYSLSLCTAIFVSVKYVVGDEYIPFFQISNFLRFWPMFFLGLLLKKHLLRIRNLGFMKGMICSILFFSLGLLLLINPLTFDIVPDGFFKFLLMFTWDQLICAVCAFFVLSFCMAIPVSAKDIVTASKGTIVTLSLHFQIIGCYNLLLKAILGIQGEICYSTPIAILIAVSIEFICYGFILVFEKYCPILLGKR